MKIALILLLALASLLTMGLGAAEQKPIEEHLDERMSLELDHHSVHDVALFLSQIFSCKVMFPKAITDSELEFTLSAKDMPVREVLDELGKQSKTTWKAKGKLVVFTSKKP